MSITVRSSSVYKSLTDAYVYSGSTPVAVQSIHVKASSVWEEVWSAEVLVIVSSSTTLLILESLFDSGVWTDTKNKRVYLASGVIVGSATTATAAIRTGTTAWGGTLTLDGHSTAEVRGAGGAGSTTTDVAGSPGGDAIDVNATGITLVVTGAFAIKAGGGGGGKGGTGTGTVTEYIAYNINTHTWGVIPNGGSQFNVYWGSLLHVGYTGATSYTHSDGYTYYRGSYVETQYSNAWYTIYRQGPGTTYGGNGGKGQGYDGAATAGATGGENAGAGGTGGAYGASGSTGVSGGDTGGSAGGASGWLIKNPDRADKTNHTGTQSGRTS